jgi:hypothetical protein
MKYIHTFWSKPLYQNKFNKFNVSLDSILLDYAYSVHCVHQFDEKIVLFADKRGAELLSFIPYDEVHIVDNMDEQSLHFAAQIKFYALEHSDLGDAIIDGDLFIRKEVANSIVKNSTADVVYSFFEPHEYTVRLDSIKSNYIAMNFIMSKFTYDAPYRLPQSWDDYGWMNTSLMRVNNQELKDEYIRQYYHHKDMLSKEDFYDCWPDIFIEQKFLTLLCEDKHYNAEPVVPNFWFDDNANDFALNIGFTHLGTGKHAHRDWVIDLLRNENPELFNLYVETYEANCLQDEELIRY